MIAVYGRGGGGDPCLFLSDNVLDTKGGGVWEGVSPSYGGDFFGFWGTKTRFLLRYKV